MRTFSALLGLLLLAGCASSDHPTLDKAIAMSEQDNRPGVTPTFEVEQTEGTYSEAYDPWQGFNRRAYWFNTKFDQYVFLPAVRGYKAITPDPLEAGIRNFFNNFGDLGNLANSLLQFKGQKAATSLGRLLINTTIGIGGLMDPATDMGLYEVDEDFGQTLGFYGVPTGPYLVIPILGPSNVRDGVGELGDFFGALEMDPINILDTPLVQILKAVDTREEVEFRYYETGSPFEYELVRALYLKYREEMVNR